MHSVFVLSIAGTPLTPTTPARARKLLRAGVAKKVWSRFGTFGVQLVIESRTEIPLTTLGYDGGTKFEGFAVVCGEENVLAVKLDLPDKKQIVRKLEQRRTLRRARHFRKCRRRPVRFDNRTRRPDWIAPSQLVLVQSRLKVLDALFAIYPIQRVGFEDVRFNHAKHRWGTNFSTVEIGKTRIKSWLAERSEVHLFEGWQTQEFRKQYGYPKTAVKSADKFTAHCSDALALACAAGIHHPILAGRFIVVDDTYRPVRRKLHDTQPAKGGVREAYSTGTVMGLRKGLLIGAKNGKVGRLSGRIAKGIRYYDAEGKRQSTTALHWISTQFVAREKEKAHSPSALAPTYSE
jgi:RRXRR protein